MNNENGSQIDEILGRAMQDDVPADVEARLRSQLAGFRDQHGNAASLGSPRSATWSPRTRWSVATAVAAVLVVAIVWGLRPRVTLADVAAAVLQQPWIHVATTDHHGNELEFWYSPTQDISATRGGGRLEYRDHRLRVYHSYDAADETLYRVPEWNPHRRDELASMVTILQVLLQNERPADNPLEQLGLIRDSRAALELVEQKLEKTEEGGREWLDWRLTFRSDETGEGQLLCRVDPETKLLHLYRLEGGHNGKPAFEQSRVDYPKRGPADVFALGVPKTAKLVDRIPSGDLERILAAHRVGRQRMDNYRAFHISSPEGVELWQLGMVVIMVRKGDQFRRDAGVWKIGGISDRASRERWPNPAEGETTAAWWAKHLKDLFVQPYSISNSSHHWYVRSNVVRGPDGGQQAVIKSIEKSRALAIAPADPLPIYWSSLPEFVCRPPMGIPHEHTAPVLELEPKNGPAGTILLRVRSAPTNGPPKSDTHRFWLDPARGYAVIRWDMLRGDEPGEEEVADSYLMEEMAQSPSGTWYATRVRRESLSPNGEKLVQILHFWVDFDADLPDSLFDIPKPGRVD